MNVKIGCPVVATKEVFDENAKTGELALFTMPGDRGEVLDFERDGELVAITAVFETAPHATTVYLGEDCELIADA